MNAGASGVIGHRVTLSAVQVCRHEPESVWKSKEPLLVLINCYTLLQVPETATTGGMDDVITIDIEK